MSELYKTLLNPKGKYGIWGIAILLLFGIALMVVPGLFLGEEKIVQSTKGIEADNTSIKSSLSQLEDNLASRISVILSQVKGAGEVSVSLSLETGVKQEFAQNVDDSKSCVEEKDNNGGIRITNENNKKVEVVFAQNGQGPVVIEEIAPRIKGVLVVAEGASDSEVKVKLSRAVCAMLNIPAHRVMVLPRERR